MMDGGASWEGQGGNDNQSPGAQVHVDFQQYLDLGMPGLDGRSEERRVGKECPV